MVSTGEVCRLRLQDQTSRCELEGCVGAFRQGCLQTRQLLRPFRQGWLQTRQLLRKFFFVDFFNAFFSSCFCYISGRPKRRGDISPPPSGRPYLSRGYKSHETPQLRKLTPAVRYAVGVTAVREPRVVGLRPIAVKHCDAVRVLRCLGELLERRPLGRFDWWGRCTGLRGALREGPRREGMSAAKEPL